MSKRELTEVEQLRHENHRLRNETESYKLARDYALRTAEQLREQLNYQVRCGVLEQLCRDLYFCAEHSKCDYCEHFEPQNDSLMSCDLMLEDRMTALGLLGGNND